VERPKKEKKTVENKTNEWGIEVVTVGDKEKGKEANVIKVEAEDNL
jgi:hypothetical protein